VATIHPIIRPPDVGHEPHNPVRDDTKTSAHEDLDREPDGVPHKVVGMTAFFSVILAMLVAFMFLAGGWTRIGAVLLVVIAVPILVSSLNKKADRDRDHLHPSR
jgi:uncharacterized membrane protein YphA (DoxX/SURF4 family)